MSGGVSPLPHTRAVFTAADEAAVLACLQSGMVAHGARVRAFEEQIAARTGAAGVVSVSSGTAALVLALRAVGIARNDEVIVPTYVCRAVYEAVRSVGAVPVLADNHTQRCISHETVRGLLSRRTKAIIVVDTLGEAAPIDALLETGIPVIEDACQGFGGVLQGRPLGLRGTVGVISFHGTKLLPIGDGGAVLCTQGPVADLLRALRDGDATDEVNAGARSGDHISDLSAALGSAVLARLDGTLERRAEIAERYRRVLANATALELPQKDNVPFRFPLRMRGATDTTYGAVAARFLEHGVSVRRGVDAMNHVLFGASNLGPSDIADGQTRAFPTAEQDFRETLSIPLYESLRDHEVETIENALKAVFSC